MLIDEISGRPGSTDRTTQAETAVDGNGSPSLGAGGTLWLTGLSGAGKTTVALAVQRKLAASGRAGARVELLDGDELRDHLSPGLGFTKQERDAHVTRVGYLARLLARNGVLVLVPVIAPYAQTRERIRDEHAAEGTPYALVYVSTSVDECARRDVKGLYAAQAEGRISHLTGVDDPYEAPASPDLDLDTTDIDTEEAADRVIALLSERGML